MGVVGGFAEEMDDFLKFQELRPKSTSSGEIVQQLMVMSLYVLMLPVLKSDSIYEDMIWLSKHRLHANSTWKQNKKKGSVGFPFATRFSSFFSGRKLEMFPVFGREVSSEGIIWPCRGCPEISTLLVEGGRWPPKLVNPDKDKKSDPPVHSWLENGPGLKMYLIPIEHGDFPWLC